MCHFRCKCRVNRVNFSWTDGTVLRRSNVVDTPNERTKFASKRFLCLIRVTLRSCISRNISSVNGLRKTMVFKYGNTSSFSIAQNVTDHRGRAVGIDLKKDGAASFVCIGWLPVLQCSPPQYGLREFQTPRQQYHNCGRPNKENHGRKSTWNGVKSRWRVGNH